MPAPRQPAENTRPFARYCDDRQRGSSGPRTSAGRVKTGFAGASDLLARLRALEAPHSPFLDGPAHKAQNHWVRPDLVANVDSAEWTASGKLRQASFKGLREDKDPATVRREVPEG